MADNIQKLDSRIQTVFAQALGMVEHEDDLVDRRLKWAITICGFLFAAYGATWIASAQADFKSPRAIDFVLSVVRVFLCFVGFYSALIASESIHAAHLAIVAVARKYKNFIHKNADAIEKYHLQVWNLIGDRGTDIPGTRSSASLPFGMMGIWVGLIFVDSLLFAYMAQREFLAFRWDVAVFVGMIASAVFVIAILRLVIRMQQLRERLQKSRDESWTLTKSKLKPDKNSLSWISEKSFKRPVLGSGPDNPERTAVDV